ncbi:MAG: hypothetical protein E7166_01740 [Firmicutes bacterium]|nr:hypothetical protein [Bacillota bacterium]
MKLRDVYESANTGLDAIKRAPIVDYESDIKCIRIQDISQNKKFHEWGNTEVNESDYNKFKLKKNDILVARTGATVGVSYIVKEDCNAVYNNGTIRLRLKDNVNCGFIYQLFQTREFRQYIDNVSCVSTQPNLKVENLLRFDIPDYSKPQQEKIAKILMKYDELILKNEEKIMTLEKIIKKTYIKWFIKNNIPNYEIKNKKKVKPYGWVLGNDNEMMIPSKWKIGKLEEIGKFVRGKNITAAEMVEGDIPVISAGINPSGYHNESNVKEFSITMSASGANAGYLKYNLCDIWAADCSYYANNKNIWFVYSSLDFISKAIDNLQVGAAQPHVYPKNINKLNIIIPEEDLIIKYNNFVNPIFMEIKNLLEQNKNLLCQKKMMLPRLMSGKLEVD